MLRTLMMRPHFRSFICGIRIRQKRICANSLRSRSPCHCSSVIVSDGPRIDWPALLTKMSTLPNSELACLQAAATQDLLLCFGERPGVARQDRDIGARGVVLLGDRQTEALAAAGDDRASSVQPNFHNPAPLVTPEGMAGRRDRRRAPSLP